ncbi:uncharacterized protein BN773_01696 [Prevotella sp. CAG:755]|nr:uncharacterized protein BN773_01696 [Prevotella sp. CAG:755]
MGAHGLGREKLGEAPLDVKPLDGVGVVAAPELVEVSERPVVAPRAAARAEHQPEFGILLADTAEHVADAPYVVHIELSLAFAQVGRIDVRYRTVAVPLQQGDLGVTRHQLVDDAEDVVLHLGVRQVEHELVAIVIGLAVGIVNGPVRVFLEQLALRVDHLRLDPYPETYAGLAGCLDKGGHAAGQFGARGLPVAQSGTVVGAGVFVAEPSVVEQEEVDAQVLGLLHQPGQPLLVEVEARALPVVQQGESFALPVVQAVTARPVVQAAAPLACALLAEREDELGRGEDVARAQLIGRSVGVDGRDDAQAAHVVHLERKAEVSCPAERPHEHVTAVLLDRCPEAQLEEGRCVHGGAAAQLGVDHFLAELQALRAHLRLARPVAAELREVVGRPVEVEHRRRVGRQRDRAGLVVRDVAPRLDHVLLPVGHVVQRDGQGILVVAQDDVGLRPAGDGLRRR